MKTAAQTKREYLRRESTRRSILQAARKLFVQGGYESFSMRRLGSAVGYSPGAIYRYFESKEKLLDALVDDAFAKLLELLDDAHDEVDAVQSLRNKLRAYVDFGLQFPDHYHLAFVRRPTERGVTMPTQPHAAFGVLRDAVERCIVDQHFRPADNETTSQILWTSVHGVTSLLIALPAFPWIDHKRLVDGAIDTAIEGLRSPRRRGHPKDRRA